MLNTYPVVPSLDVLQAFKTPVSIYSLASDIRAPYSMQSAISIEHSLPHNLRSSVTFSHTRTLHMLRARAINTPLPGTFNPKGTCDARAVYNRLDVVVRDSSSFVALRDKPGACPGDDWQMIACGGKRGVAARDRKATRNRPIICKQV